MIPKVLHTVWFGDRPPGIVNQWRGVVGNDWEICIHHNPSGYDHLLKNTPALAADAARMDIMYREGGVYLDTDVVLVRKPDHLLDFEGLTIGIENPSDTDNPRLCTAILIAPPGLDLMIKAREYIDQHAQPDTLGLPEVFTVMQPNPMIRPSRLYDAFPFPPPKNHRWYEGLTADTTFVHLWAGSWLNPPPIDHSR